MEQFALLEKAIADWITLNVTIYVLIGVGLFLTVRSLFVQVRLFPEMIRTVLGSRKGADGGISSFQAFAISLAARVGIGNVFGVAAALLMGGPGAIFWMWVVALVGMGTAFFEATLAQIFKVKHSDGSFRGGPAYYMKRGMKNRVLANIFAVITVVTCGIVITSVQSNAIAGTLTSAFGEAAKQPLQGAGGFSAAQLTIAGLIFVFSAMVIFGGVRTVARVTEWMAPIMATIYVIMVAIICLMNLSQFGTVLGQIFTSAFSAQANVGGLGGGIVAAMINGTKRGLFSNEAGQGTAPNAAATATVSHPVRQGLIQSLGVFIDTIVVCTATAFVILLAGPEVWGGDGVEPDHPGCRQRAGRVDDRPHGDPHLRAGLLLGDRRLRLLRHEHVLRVRRRPLGDLDRARRVRPLCDGRCAAEPGRRVERRRHRDGGHDDHEPGGPGLPGPLGAGCATRLRGAASKRHCRPRLRGREEPAAARQRSRQRVEAPQAEEEVTPADHLAGCAGHILCLAHPASCMSALLGATLASLR